MVLKSTSFKHNLMRGRVAESRIATWLRNRGWTILPVYELETDAGKGPQVYAPNSLELVAPDMVAYRNKCTRFIEAKCKTVFSWYRKGSCWVTGIDLRHWREYQTVSRIYDDWDVWLLFLHECGTPSEEDQRYRCPPECPTGLFGQSLTRLLEINHESDRHGRSGMVYWRHDQLDLFATLDEL